VGFLYLADETFLGRASTITASEEKRDTSAQSRIVLAKAGLQMWSDHPLGVGPGNFYQTIGRYVPEYAGKDAHNTYVRCLTELGIVGFGVFTLMILSAFLTLRQTARRAEELLEPERSQITILAYGMTCCLTTMLACCLTVSLIYAEFVWCFLMLPSACSGPPRT